MDHQENTALTKRKDGERKCKTCNLAFPDIYAYTEHLESKEHTSGLMKKKYGEKYLEAKAKLAGRSSEKDDDSSDDKSNEDEGEVYTCEVCAKVCTGLLSYKLHLSGKKHRKIIKKSKLLMQMQKDKIIPEDVKTSENNSLMDALSTENQFSTSDILCKVCNKKCMGPQSYKAHLNSESHKKKVATQNLSKELEDKSLNAESNDNDDDDNEPTLFARCDVCCKSFSGPLPFKQHIESPSHLKQIKQAKKMDQLKDFLISSEDDKIKCRECNKYFSGPKPFQDHLNSASHMRQKKKDDLMKNLQEKYSEMVIKSNLKLEDSDESDNAIIICCKICHIAFTGPESARDHFVSKNHKKTKKAKVRLGTLKIINDDESTKPESNISNVNELTKISKDSDSDSTDSFQVLDAHE